MIYKIYTQKINKKSKNPKFQNFKISKFWNFKISKFQNFKISNFKISKLQNFKHSKFQNYRIPKLQNSQTSKWVHTWSDFFEIVDSQISIDNICPRCFHILSNIFWGILAYPKINKVGFEGLRHVKTLRNHEIWSFGPLK